MTLTIKNKIKRLFFPLNRNHSVKEAKVLACRNLLGATTFIETGTYLGEMVQAVKSAFTKIHSIELNPQLAHEAEAYFKSQSHIFIHQGDSGLVLKDLLKKIQKPSVFWLDAHYSSGVTAKSDLYGDTPVLEELSTILNWWILRSAVLIDDARLFVGKDGYPTLEDVQSLVTKENPSLTCFVESDIIHIF